jgi:chromosome segregation ATPase
LAALEKAKRVELEATCEINARALQKAQERILALESQLLCSSSELREANCKVYTLTELCGQQDSQRNAAVDRIRALEKEFTSVSRLAEQHCIEKRQLAADLALRTDDSQKLRRDVEQAVADCRAANRFADDTSAKLKILSGEHARILGTERNARARIDDLERELESVRSQYRHLHEQATRIIQELELKVSENISKCDELEKRFLTAQSQVAAREFELSLLRVKRRQSTPNEEMLQFELQQVKARLTSEEAKSADMQAKTVQLEAACRGLRAELQTSRDLMELTMREKISLQEELKLDAYDSSGHLRAMEAQLNKLKELYDKAARSYEQLEAKYDDLTVALTARVRKAAKRRRNELAASRTDDIGALLLERSELKKKHVEEVMALKRRLTLAEAGIQDQVSSIDRMLTELQRTVEEFRRDSALEPFGDSVTLVLNSIRAERLRIDSRCEIWDKVVAIDLSHPENTSHMLLSRRSDSSRPSAPDGTSENIKEEQPVN